MAIRTGFFIVELIIALVLFISTAAVVALAFGRTMNIKRSSEQRLKALSYATDTIEKVIAQKHTPSPISSDYKLSVEKHPITYAGIALNVVRVVVSWKSIVNGKECQLSLSRICNSNIC